MNPWLMHSPPITMYGFCIVVGLILAWVVGRRNARREGVEASHVDLLVPVVVAAGLVGAYGFGVWTDVATGVTSHGTVLIGSLLVATVAGILYGVMAGIPLGKLGDITAGPIAVGIACGRVGCFFAGCYWGKPSAMPGWMTGVRFPNGSFVFVDQFQHRLLAASAGGSLPVYPVQLYEAVFCAGVAVVLSGGMSRQKVSGERFLWLGILYAVGRFGLEFLRGDNPAVGWGLTFSQCAMVGVLATAVGTMVVRRRWSGRWGLPGAGRGKAFFGG